MQASPMKLLQLLGDNRVIFKIPVYQRNYEWRQEQVEQYFLDIERIAESNYKKNHFLGTIVFVAKEVDNLMMERILIDGQQRVTTTILLLKAIIDIIKEDENYKGFINTEEIHETYLINRHAPENSRLRLKPVEADMDAFNKLMNNNESTSRIYDNYLLLKNLLLNSEYTIEELYKAMESINVVYISLDQDENPQVIFESLNSTGLSLTQADLIRNFILMGLEYEEQTILYKKYWTEIEELLPNKVISDFVRDFLTMKEGKVPNKNKVYEAFKNYYFNYKYDSEKILKELLIYAKYYDFILNSYTGINGIDEELRNINNIRSTVTYPYLLELFNDYYKKRLIDQVELEQILKMIVSYIYRRNICSIPTNALNKIFSVMPEETRNRRVDGFSYAEASVDFLMSRSGSGIFPRDNEFKQNFMHANMYSKSHKIAKLILYNVEKNQHKEVVAMDDLSVEHILPQKLTSVWQIELGRNAYETHQLYSDTIGNLALTNYNSEMSNRSFADKKSFYKNSNIKTTRDIAAFAKWQENEVLIRAELLYEIVKDIWELPEDNYQNIGEKRLVANQEYSIHDTIDVTGYKPRYIIIDGEYIGVSAWNEMLAKTAQYLYDLDRELFKSLLSKNNFKNILSYQKEELRNPKEITSEIFIEGNYSAQNVIGYIDMLAAEYEINDLVYFEIR